MTKFLVSIGSYERIVFGCDVEVDEDANTVISMKDSFAVPAHIASVRSVASCKKFLVSGSTDETIKYAVTILASSFLHHVIGYLI